MHKRMSAASIIVALAASLTGCPSSTAPTAGTAGPAAQTVTGGGHHQKDRDCPASLADFCGGWTIFDRVDELENHVEKRDRFVIGRKSSGQNAGLWLYPRPEELKERWNNTGKVRLVEKQDDENETCLVGAVRVTNHANATPPHTWHGITIHKKLRPAAEIGIENTLTLCMIAQVGSNPPSQCAPSNCYEDEDVDDKHPGSHGGRAHAED